jgi:hypothetical protein
LEKCYKRSKSLRSAGAPNIRQSTRGIDSWEPVVQWSNVLLPGKAVHRYNLQGKGRGMGISEKKKKISSQLNSININSWSMG